MGRTSSYPAEFRQEAVRLVLHTDKTAAQLARADEHAFAGLRASAEAVP